MDCEYHDGIALDDDDACPKCEDELAEDLRRWDHARCLPVSPTYCSGCYRTHVPTDCPHQQG